MMFGSLLRKVHPIALLLILAGCVMDGLTPATPETKEGQTNPVATMIERLEIYDVGKGSRIDIQTNGTLTYQAMQLDNPTRLLLNLKGVHLAPSIQPRNLELSNISALFPVETKEGDVRLEIVLKKRLSYDVEERADGLNLTILSETSGEQKNDIVLRDIQVSHGVTGTAIRMVGSGVFPAPQAYRLNDPPRLVVDLFGPTTQMQNRKISVNSPEVTSVSVGNNLDKVRLVMELADPKVTFSIDQNEGLPIIHLSHGSHQDVNNKQRSLPNVADVLFTRESDSDIIRVQMDRSDVSLDSSREANDLLVTIKGANIPKKLVRRMDVASFGGITKAIDTYDEDRDVRLIVRLSDTLARHEIMQKDKDILIKIRSLKNADAGTQLAFTGEKISMDFKDIDIQNALKLIAEISGLNIITSDTVNGKLTMRLLDVPWDQALDLVLESKGLGKSLQGNVLRIAPLQELRMMAEARMQANQSAEQLESLTTEVIPVSYADVGALKTILEEGDAAQGTRLLSNRGAVSTDLRSNTLVVKDTSTSMVKIRQMIKKLDQTVPQVLIEARIVEVERSSTTNFGINWGFGYLSSTNNTVKAISGNANSAADYWAAKVAGETPTITPNVNLMGSAISNIGMSFGRLNPLMNLNIELGAMELVNKARTISSPRILTTNNTAASIRQGVQHPYQTVEDGSTQINFIEASLRLDVTPKVTPDGFVTLKVKASNNSVGTTGSPPPINTKEIETAVLLKNGETIVLGGIYQNTDSRSDNGIPGLQEIPLFGWLFKNYNAAVSQTELLIFLTPRIIPSGT